MHLHVSALKHIRHVDVILQQLYKVWLALIWTKDRARRHALHIKRLSVRSSLGYRV